MIGLAKPIRDYFSATNGGRPNDVALAFSADGKVRDERTVHSGRAAIAAWAGDTMARYQMQNDLLSVSHAEGRQTVLARVSGSFPGSPLDFTYHFTLVDDGIGSLEIVL